MCPHHDAFAALAEAGGHGVGRLQDLGPADLRVLGVRQVADDQLPQLVENDVAIAAVAELHDEAVAPAYRFAVQRLEGFPHAFAGLRLDAAELAVAAESIDVAAAD